MPHLQVEWLHWRTDYMLEEIRISPEDMHLNILQKIGHISWTSNNQLKDTKSFLLSWQNLHIKEILAHWEAKVR